MTVAEYIQALQQLPQEAEVLDRHTIPVRPPEGVRRVHVRDGQLTWSCTQGEPDDPCDECEKGVPLVQVVVL